MKLEFILNLIEFASAVNKHNITIKALFILKDKKVQEFIGNSSIFHEEKRWNMLCTAKTKFWKYKVAIHGSPGGGVEIQIYVQFWLLT